MLVVLAATPIVNVPSTAVVASALVIASAAESAEFLTITGTLALGMFMILLTGQIDLAAGSGVGLVAGKLLPQLRLKCGIDRQQGEQGDRR